MHACLQDFRCIDVSMILRSIYHNVRIKSTKVRQRMCSINHGLLFFEVKSSFRARILLLSWSSSDDSLRLRRFGGAAFTPGPVEFWSTFPSSSSKGLDETGLGGFGSFDGWDGYGSAEKYAWSNA